MFFGKRLNSFYWITIHNSKKAVRSSYPGLQEVLKALEKAKVRLRANVNFEVAMELLILVMKEN